MPPLGPPTRALARQVAGWLVDRDRPDDAVSVLCAAAAGGPNDAEGQELLAHAMRLAPSAKLAQQAFERMEGLAGEQRALDAALERWSGTALAALAEELRPSFRRAQMGFNNNVTWKGHTFHVQTEDSGLDAPHIITHLFADGGRVIKSHKRSYAGELRREDLAGYVRGLMKEQHMEMLLLLRDGRFDRILAGEERGGVEVFTTAPNVDVQRLARRAKKEHTAPSVQLRVQEAAPVRVRLLVMRPGGRGPELHTPPGDDVLLGLQGQVTLADDPFSAPKLAWLRWRNGRLTVEDVESARVFLRARQPVELEPGDEFLVGDQLLCVTRNPTPDDHPGPGPTYFWCLKRRAQFRVTQLLEGGREGACALATTGSLQIGSVIGDLLFGRDPLVDPQHCIVEEQAGSLVLTDLGSRSGVFVRVRGEQELQAGDELVLGRTRIVVQPR